jgi:hypothetical protein
MTLQNQVFRRAQRLAPTPEAQLELGFSRENEWTFALNCLMLEPILRSSIKNFTGESLA